MPRTIERDYDHFRKIIGGRIRKGLQRYIKTGKFVRLRTKGGKGYITTRSIDIPHIVYGENDQGVGRGPGRKGDVVKKDPKPGDDSAGNEEGEGITVQIDLEDILMFMQEELQLPDLKPKETETFEEIDIKYNDIALTGPESLRHNRRTMLQAMRRLAASNELDKLYYIPGFTDPVRLITPINSDRRYRQYKEIRIPSSNAVIMFGRDGSYSMSDEKCEIISDMAWWIECWVKRFYENVEVCYFWHDVAAQELDRDTFYSLRHGGGTACSSCLKLMAKQFENRFLPEKWNIYCLYFTDGDNWEDDNTAFLQTLTENFQPSVCNLFAITQILCSNYPHSIKKLVEDQQLDMPNLRTCSIGSEDAPDFNSIDWSDRQLAEDERNEQIKKAIKYILSPAGKAEEVS